MKQSLFRTIRRKLLEEGKLLRYLTYALGEIVLIVVGILLALKISDWNEDRKAQRELDEYVVQLRKDVRTAIGNIERVVRRYDEVFIPNVAALTAILDSDKSLSENTEILDKGLVTLGLYYESQIEVGLLGQIFNGNMGILGRDQGLALATMNMESRVEQTLATMEHNYDWLDSFQTKLVEFRGRGLMDRKPPIYDPAQIRSSNEFENIAYTVLSTYEAINLFNGRLQEELSDFLAVMEEYE